MNAQRVYFWRAQYSLPLERVFNVLHYSFSIRFDIHGILGYFIQRLTHHHRRRRHRWVAHVVVVDWPGSSSSIRGIIGFFEFLFINKHNNLLKTLKWCVCVCVSPILRQWRITDLRKPLLKQVTTGRGRRCLCVLCFKLFTLWSNDENCPTTLKMMMMMTTLINKHNSRKVFRGI